MYNVNKNTLIKDTIVSTDKDLADFIFKKVSRKPYKHILDIGCFDGSLSKPFSRKSHTEICGVDVVANFEENFDTFINKDFIQCSREDFGEVDIIVSNPPFNDLAAWKWIEHCRKIFGDIPMIFIVPEYILNNSKSRAIELENYNITKIVKLNQYTFKDVAIHCSVVYFNIHFKNTKLFEYYYPKREIKGKVRTLYFTKEQEQYLQEELKIKNFTKYIKSLIHNDNPDFPI